MSGESFDKVDYAVSGGVATVTLNDLEKRNMLSGQMLSELVAAMETARDSEEVRTVVLTGAGDRVFCAGADLGGFAADASLIEKHYASDLFLDGDRVVGGILLEQLKVAHLHTLYDGNPGYPDMGAPWDLAEKAEITTFGTSAAYISACMKAGLEPAARRKLSRLRAVGSTGLPLAPEASTGSTSALGVTSGSSRPRATPTSARPSSAASRRSPYIAASSRSAASVLRSSPGTGRGSARRPRGGQRRARSPRSVKRILMGAEPAKVVSRDSLANPEALDYFQDRVADGV